MYTYLSKDSSDYPEENGTHQYEKNENEISTNWYMYNSGDFFIAWEFRRHFYDYVHFTTYIFTIIKSSSCEHII